MDERISDVFREYDARIAEERGRPGGLPRPGEVDHRMRAVGPATGQLINILARSLEAPTILEIGTSYGYSGIWLADAARATGGRVITMELHDYKSAYARDMAAKAGLADYIDFRVGDAVEMIAGLEIGVDFVLLDLWKDLYLPCFEAFYPKLNPGAIVVADNMRPNNEAILPYGRAVRAKPGMASVLLPVGSGIEVSRYEPEGSPYEPHTEAPRHAVFEGDGPAAPDRFVADGISPHQQKEQRRDV
jgi:predicted O-methyltransferase YrrM